MSREFDGEEYFSLSELNSGGSPYIGKKEHELTIHQMEQDASRRCHEISQACDKRIKLYEEQARSHIADAKRYNKLANEYEEDIQALKKEIEQYKAAASIGPTGQL
jgi:hypothetical protein